MLQDFLEIRHDLLLHLAHFELNLLFHVRFQFFELVFLSFYGQRRHEDERLERILLAIEPDYFLHEEVELLLLLEQEARAHVLDFVVSHTDLGNQEIEQHDLHDENVGNEEEPSDGHYCVLVVVRQVPLIVRWLVIRVAIHIVRNPIAVSWFRQVANRVSEGLQDIDPNRKWFHEWIVFFTVSAFKDESYEREYTAKGEEKNQERINIF